MQDKSEQHSHRQEPEGSLDLLEKLGLKTEGIAEAFRTYLTTSVSTVALQDHDKFVAAAPQAIAMCEFLAARKPIAQTYITLGSGILKQDSTSRPLASYIAEQINTKLQPKESLSATEWGNLFLFIGRLMSEIAEEAKRQLEEFSQRKPNVLAALILFPKLKEIKAHEFIGSLSKQGDRIDLSNPVDYVATVFLALCLRREDIIAKAIDFRLANELTCGTIEQRYVELGGQQSIMEKLAQDYLTSQRESITQASFLDGTVIDQAQKVLAKLEPLLNDFQEEAIEELKSAKRWDDLSRPKSLDTEIESENGEVTTFAEMVAGPPDLDEAMPQFLEIYERLDPEDRELLEQLYFEGRSLEEIAMERDWEYDRTQKRAKRLEKKITDMLTKMPE